jgi:hypothetical protein
LSKGLLGDQLHQLRNCRSSSLSKNIIEQQQFSPLIFQKTETPQLQGNKGLLVLTSDLADRVIANLKVEIILMNFALQFL